MLVFCVKTHKNEKNIYITNMPQNTLVAMRGLLRSLNL
jgi:hypothetical protein